MLSQYKMVSTIWLITILLNSIPFRTSAFKIGKNDTALSDATPFFDLTDALNQNNASEISKALRITSHIYYSTDLLVSQILDLSWIAELLKSFEDPDKDQRQSICLIVSFKMTKYRDQLDYRHLQDVLYVSPESLQNNPIGHQLLKKLLCKVILDFQAFDYPGQIAENSMGYSRKWDVSFTRNAKQLLHKIWDSGYEIHTVLEVGVTYNEQQIGKDKLLLEQELCHADFLIANFTYIPVARTPIYYNVFVKELETMQLANEQFLKSLKQNSTTIRNIPQVYFMITWVPVEKLSGLRPEEKIMFENEATYLEIFQTFLGKYIKDNIFNVGIISGILFNPSNFQMNWLDDTRMDKMVPYLYAHSVDTSQCQLQAMMGKISNRFDEFVVNEFTWSALASFNKIKSGQTKNERVELEMNQTAKALDVMLFTTINLGDSWNQTRKPFAKLIQSSPKIGSLKLNTIVFRQNLMADQDAYADRNDQDDAKLYMESKWGQDLQALVHHWLELKDTNKIGCLVEFNGNEIYQRSSAYLKIQKKCQPIFKQASVLIIQFTLESLSVYTSNFTEFNPTRDRKNYLMNAVMPLFALRKYLLNKYVFKRIIVKFVTKDANEIRPDTWSIAECNSYLHFEWILLKNLYRWADIHDVDLITKPAFDLRYPALGYWKPPQNNGGSAKYHAFCDY